LHLRIFIKMEIIVTSSDKHITEAFASIVVASGNIAQQATNFDQLPHFPDDQEFESVAHQDLDTGLFVRGYRF